MSAIPRPTFVTLLLTAACLGLLALTARLMFGPPPISARVQAPAMAAPEIPPVVSSAGSTANIMRRPVFMRDRKPLQFDDSLSGTSSTAGGPTRFTNLVLRGIVVAGAARRAGFSDGNGAPTVWVNEGDEFSGWRVVEVLPDQVRLSNGSNEELLRLYERNEN